MSKLLLPIERGGQYDSFDMPIISLRQLVMALGQIFSFFLYTGNMTSQQHSGDLCDAISVKNEKESGNSRDYVKIYRMTPKS